MQLTNDRLTIQFAAPEEMDNRRFDHTAMIKSVVLDGKHEFCVPEQVLPERRTCNGFGLSGEFVLPGAAERAKAGEWFVKPGVGLLKQLEDGAPWSMWKCYECRLFQREARMEGESAVFVQRGEVCGGYGVAIEKTFTLCANRLKLCVRATNTGNEAIELREYQHNFVSLGAQIGPGYELELSCDRTLESLTRKTLRQGDEAVLPSAVCVEGDRVIWMDDLRGKVLYHRSEQTCGTPPCRWRMRHTGTGISISEETDFSPSRVDIWAVEHCACPEFYKTVCLAPGETASWRRTWTFDV